LHIKVWNASLKLSLIIVRNTEIKPSSTSSSVHKRPSLPITAMARRSHCGFVAPYILKAIATSQAVSPECRGAAEKSLLATQSLMEQRKIVCHNAACAAPSQPSQPSVPSAQGSQHRAPQGIIPPHILKSISSSDAVEPETRASAQQTLLTSQFVLDARGQHAEDVAKKPPAKARKRKIFDCRETEQLQQNSARVEGAKRVKDRSVNNAYDGLGIVYDFYYNIFGRNSIDDKGMDLIGNVHFEPADAPAGYDNAYWDGEQMVFGDGDGEIFDDFTDGLDVLAHELTHGVTQYTAKLKYQDQAGALNESMSDVFACMCEQWWFGQTAEEGDWLLGQGLLSMLRRGPALRSLKAPGTAYRNDPILGTDPQPANMSGYVKGPDDNGGVHLNSGIPNHAFYLAAIGLGGFSWDKPGQIWYKTLQDPLIPTDCNFKQFAELTIKHALALYGPGPGQTVKSAWTAVGVLP
jgi:Zn-dependent metalloprotease